MDVRWIAVFNGLMADFALTFLIGLLTGATDEFYRAPDPSRADHLAIIALNTLATGVGGFVAGRLAGARPFLHGLLVAVLGILLNHVGSIISGMAIPRAFLVASVIGCLIGAIGGGLSALRLPRRG